MTSDSVRTISRYDSAHFETLTVGNQPLFGFGVFGRGLVLSLEVMKVVIGQK